VPARNTLARFVAESQNPMATVIKQKEYELMEEGLHNVVVSRIEDLGKVETQHGVKEMAEVWFKALDQKAKDGGDVEARIRVNCVLGAKSTLRKSILGPLGIVPGKEFDLNSLVGVKCQILIQHNTIEDGRTFANVSSVLKTKKSQEV
jgi:hypothetical protein